MAGAWSVVKALNGGGRKEAGGAITYRGRRCGFCEGQLIQQEYADVRGRLSDKTSRKKVVAMARRIRSYVTEDPPESDFTASELDRALGKIKSGKDAGPDVIRSYYIVRLTSKAKD